MTRPIPVGILVSGEGTTLDALSERVVGGHIPARIALVLADRPHARAIERARLRGLPTAVVPSRGVDAEVWSSRLTRALRECGVELVVLAGFLSILPPSFVQDWAGHAVNVHPSLLPRYGGPGMYGPRVHEAVIAAGDRETGVTVHLVTDRVDAGPPLAQARLEVRPDDTPQSLRERLRPLEVELLSDVIRRFAEGSLPASEPDPSASVGAPSTGADDPTR